MGTFYHVPHIMYLQSCSSLGIALLQKSNSFWRMGLWGALKAWVSHSLISLEILISGNKSSSGRRRTCKTQRRHAEPLLPEEIHTRNGSSPNPTLQFWEKCVQTAWAITDALYHIPAPFPKISHVASMRQSSGSSCPLPVRQPTACWEAKGPGNPKGLICAGQCTDNAF